MDVTMALQCRNNVAVLPAMSAKAAAPRARAVTIKMSTHESRCGAAQGRDWRIYASNNGSEDSGTGLYATVEKAKDVASTQDVKWFGSSEAFSDEGSSFLAVESVLETDGGKSVEDYKLRAHIFSESAIFFAALKDRNSRNSQSN